MKSETDFRRDTSNTAETAADILATRRQSKARGLRFPPPCTSTSSVTAATGGIYIPPSRRKSEIALRRGREDRRAMLAPALSCLLSPSSPDAESFSESRKGIRKHNPKGELAV